MALTNKDLDDINHFLTTIMNCHAHELQVRLSPKEYERVCDLQYAVTLAKDRFQPTGYPQGAGNRHKTDIKKKIKNDLKYCPNPEIKSITKEYNNRHDLYSSNSP